MRAYVASARSSVRLEPVMARKRLTRMGIAGLSSLSPKRGTLLALAHARHLEDGCPVTAVISGAMREVQAEGAYSSKVRRQSWLRSRRLKSCWAFTGSVEDEFPAFVEPAEVEAGRSARLRRRSDDGITGREARKIEGRAHRAQEVSRPQSPLPGPTAKNNSFRLTLQTCLVFRLGGLCSQIEIWA